jgi:hypothetical protein
MKNRTVFAFLAGFATCAAALYAAGNHTPAIYFAAGVLAATAALMGLGWAFNRGARRHHRRAIARRPRPTRPMATAVQESTDARRKCEPGTFKKPTVPADPMPADPIEADVISALKNFGASKSQARDMARRAMIAAGAGAGFDQIMREAVRKA